MALPKDIIELMRKSGCRTVTHLISTISALLLLLTVLALGEHFLFASLGSGTGSDRFYGKHDFKKLIQ
ncbi:AAEL006233-PB [Aedes aegypti]|uniref:AAEL006233-PA n=1 Tax=Aedes aegypti TaxID=7159 RepID=Q176V8_AEDAE|nr:AAEL006233-PA [Aedes aegypti]EAT42215.1 AAEL006233-PB [Aedes aegypti]